jgi:hypothetical protein
VAIPFYAIVDYRSGLETRHVIVLGYRWAEDGYVSVRLDKDSPDAHRALAERSVFGKIVLLP